MPTEIEPALARVDTRPLPGPGAGSVVTVGCRHGEARLGFTDARGRRRAEGRAACMRTVLTRHRAAYRCRCTASLWTRYVGADAGESRRLATEQTPRASSTARGSSPRALCHPAGGGLPWMVAGCVLIAMLMFGGTLGLGIGLAYGGALCIGVWLLETARRRGGPRALPPARRSIYEWRPTVRRDPWWSL